MNYDKRMILFDQKMGMVHYIEMENEVYKDEINEIKEKNKKLEDSVKTKIEELEIKNKINFGQLKKKVMKDLKDAKKNILTLNLEHMDINGKIILFQNYKLLSQIEYQRQEIELLRKENKDLKFRIINLEKEVDINEKVKEKLASKLSSKINKSMNLFNKTSNFNKYKQDLFNMTKNYIINDKNKEKLIESNILNSSSTQYENNDKNTNELNLTFNKNKIKINKIKKYCLKDDEGNHSDSNNKYILQSPNKSKINNHISFNEIHTEKINRIKNANDIINKISLTKKNENINIYNNEERKRKNKVIREQNYEIENLKMKVDNIKNKLSFYIDKYKGIYDFLEECINNFFSDIEDKNKNFLLRIDEIKKFNFENFTKEEKYSILVLLMNHLLPLIIYNFNSNCNIGSDIFSTNINIFNSTFDKRRIYLNDNILKKAFIKKNNKLQKELFLKDNTFNNGSIPVLRKKNVSVDLKIKDDKYKLVVK